MFFTILAKEVLGVKENVAFNAATILSPLLFLFAFAFMVSGDVTLPVDTRPAAESSAFLQSAEQFRNPAGQPYLDLRPAQSATPDSGSPDRYLVDTEPTVTDDGVTGHITHVVNDVNANMTKNYANRLDGAVVHYLTTHGAPMTVSVVDAPRYPHDIPWGESFAVSTLVFAAMLAGLLFGQFSMTSEWENATTTILALTPRPRVVAAGKIAGAVTKSLLAGAVLIGVIAAMYARIIPHPVHLFAGLALIYLAFSGVGMTLGIFVRSTMTAFLISLVGSLSLWVGGGGFGDLSYFGAAARLIGALNPATYGIEVVRYGYFGAELGPYPLLWLVVGAGVTTTASIIVFARFCHSEKVAS
ncbi:ABC transporter permease [Corynebacterium uterequi]|uniref:ABC-2 family transporter protein n=1 Tax=Corynebacterium uterequi TaxID=1072256 RepID=A0A0G3HCQ0_9CORY|nr:ABC transporter permease [Corynebacterium uterequi]AKK11116.1 ABC-2 family transporter protein [Corynebacterium uterequi]